MLCSWPAYPSYSWLWDLSWMAQPASLWLFLFAADGSCPLLITSHGSPLLPTYQLPRFSPKSPPHQL